MLCPSFDTKFPGEKPMKEKEANFCVLNGCMNESSLLKVNSLDPTCVLDPFTSSSESLSIYYFLSLTSLISSYPRA